MVNAVETDPDMQSGKVAYFKLTGMITTIYFGDDTNTRKCFYLACKECKKKL